MAYWAYWLNRRIPKRDRAIESGGSEAFGQHQVGLQIEPEAAATRIEGATSDAKSAQDLFVKAHRLERAGSHLVVRLGQPHRETANPPRHVPRTTHGPSSHPQD